MSGKLTLKNLESDKVSEEEGCAAKEDLDTSADGVSEVQFKFWPEGLIFSGVQSKWCIYSLMSKHIGG